MFGTAIGRVGASGYNGGFFYDSPAMTNQFNLQSAGCASGACGGGSPMMGSPMMGGPAMGGCCSGATSNGYSNGYDAGMISTGGLATPTAPRAVTPVDGSLSPASSILPGNVVGEGT